MSETRDILADVVSERQVFTGDTCKNLRSGKTFVAEIESVQDIELNVELGRDARESVILHISDDAQIADQQMNDQVLVPLLGVLTRLQIIRRSNNPANPQADFGCMHVTDKDS